MDAVNEAIEISKECKWCGKFFVPHRYNQVYCKPDCQVAHREYRRLHSNDIILKSHPVCDNMKKISAISRKAREEGFSYGQYVAKYKI